VHNGSVTGMRATEHLFLARAVVLVAAGSLILSSCGGGDSDASDESSPSPTSTVAVPEDVSLTEAGSELSFGDVGTVIYEPSQKRGSVLELTVKKVAKGSVKDFSSFILDAYTKSATPYYVTVNVKNAGESDIGGAAIPLLGVDAENTLLPAASFTTDFAKCDSDALPAKFGAGETHSTCLVFLAPDKGTLDAVSFRPTQEFDPITWTGDIVTPKPAPKPQPKKPSPKKKPGPKKPSPRKPKQP
jgi:hypothetical protein